VIGSSISRSQAAHRTVCHISPQAIDKPTARLTSRCPVICSSRPTILLTFRATRCQSSAVAGSCCRPQLRERVSINSAACPGNREGATRQTDEARR
jgi:hypothetical protein